MFSCHVQIIGACNKKLQKVWRMYAVLNLCSFVKPSTCLLSFTSFSCSINLFFFFIISLLFWRFFFSVTAGQPYFTCLQSISNDHLIFFNQTGTDETSCAYTFFLHNQVTIWNQSCHSFLYHIFNCITYSVLIVFVLFSFLICTFVTNFIIYIYIYIHMYI